MPVKGFEKFTHNLRQIEVQNLPRLLDFLSTATPLMPITSRDIQLFFGRNGYKIDGARVRKMVNFIRTEMAPSGKVLLAGAKGYFWSDDCKHIVNYSESLRNRYNEIRRVMYHIVKILETIENETQDADKKRIATEEKNAIEQSIQGKLF